MQDLGCIFEPESVAVSGVSPGNAGERYTDYLLQYGFKGGIYPLRPKGGEFRGLRLYPSIKDVPGRVDLIICCIPAQHVPQLLSDGAAKGVKAAVLHTAGFSETGRREGRELEAEVVRVAQATGMRIVGPNCMGVYRPKAGLRVPTRERAHGPRLSERRQFELPGPGGSREGHPLQQGGVLRQCL
jgi:acyl-CoA synthetase (NDP forming)